MNRNLKILGFVVMLAAAAGCRKVEMQTDEISVAPSKNAAVVRAITATYYVDNVSGNDSNDGLSPTTAWKNVSKVNTITFAPGNQILFKAGGSWTNRLAPKGSGTANEPIVIGSYGTGARPKINGAGVAGGTIYLFNQEYWEIHDLEVTNFNPTEEGGISISTWEANNTANYANVTLPPQAIKNNTAKIGILVEAEDLGQVNHIYLQNLYVHGINGTIAQADEESKNNGGIAFRIIGAVTPTWFDDVLVENCTLSNIDRTGMFNTSTWDDRTFTSNINWTPSTNLVVRNNVFSNIGANALIVRVANQPLMERNLFDYCAIKISGNAAFNFNTDWAKWQFNEARNTKMNVGDRDAGGLDADYKTKNTVIQYNFLHDNDHGMLVTGGGNSFNDNTQVKYNIIENDGKQSHPVSGKFAMKVSGAATNTNIYNNTIHIGSGQTNTAIFRHTQWTQWPDNTFYYNNIVRNEGSGSTFNMGSSTSNTFDYNIFYENVATSTPSQVHTVTGFVKLVNPGAGDPNGYKLRSGSVALLAGKVIPNNGNKDYFGNSVSSTTSPNIGAYNGPGL